MPHKKYKQLKLSMDFYHDHYDGLPLSFKLNRKLIEGVLYGDVNDWSFRSYSSYFLQIVPTGVLHKYALWINHVPGEISDLYNSIMDAALKRGYNIIEKEEAKML